MSFDITSHPDFFPLLWRLVVVFGVGLALEMFENFGSYKRLSDYRSIMMSVYSIGALVAMAMNQYILFTFIGILLSLSLYQTINRMDVHIWSKLALLLSFILSGCVIVFMPMLFYVVPIMLLLLTVITSFFLPSTTEGLIESAKTYLIANWWIFVGMHPLLMTDSQDHLIVFSFVLVACNSVCIHVLKPSLLVSLREVGIRLALNILSIAGLVAVSPEFFVGSNLSLIRLVAMIFIMALGLLCSQKLLVVYRTYVKKPSKTTQTVEDLMSGVAFVSAIMVYFLFI